jgi:hypothetical protein
MAALNVRMDPSPIPPERLSAWWNAACNVLASVAEGLVSAAVRQRMMNHAVAADVTLGHYVVVAEAARPSLHSQVTLAATPTVADYHFCGNRCEV